jgi:hypothetical protein
MHGYSLLWKHVYCSVTLQWPPLLVPLFWLSAVMSHCSLVRMLIPSSLQVYRLFFFSQGTWQWRLWLPLWTVLLHPVGSDTSASDFKAIQPLLLMAWVSHCCSPTAHSLGLLVSGCFPGGMLASSGVPPASSFLGVADSVHRSIDFGDYPIWFLQWGLKLGWLSFSVGWAIQPNLVILLVAWRFGQTLVEHFHSVTGQLQTLVGVIVGVT